MSEVVCMCSKKHVPLPRTLEQIVVKGRVVWLCPTSFQNLHDLLTVYRASGSVPDGSVTKHYGKYVRDLADQVWVDTAQPAML